MNNLPFETFHRPSGCIYLVEDGISLFCSLLICQFPDIHPHQFVSGIPVNLAKGVIKKGEVALHIHFIISILNARKDGPVFLLTLLKCTLHDLEFFYLSLLPVVQVLQLLLHFFKRMGQYPYFILPLNMAEFTLQVAGSKALCSVSQHSYGPDQTSRDIKAQAPCQYNAQEHDPQKIPLHFENAFIRFARRLLDQDSPIGALNRSVDPDYFFINQALIFLNLPCAVQAADNEIRHRRHPFHILAISLEDFRRFLIGDKSAAIVHQIGITVSADFDARHILP